MSEREMESYINEFLSGDAQKNAQELAAYLRAGEARMERFRYGYWEDKLYWVVKYKNETVFQILINGYEEGHWVVWTDDSGSDWYKDYSLDGHTKEIVWKNVGFCGNGGCCRNRGTRKVIFGNEFDNVCLATLRFNDPNAEAVECLKKIADIRKTDISNNNVTS